MATALVLALGEMDSTLNQVFTFFFSTHQNGSNFAAMVLMIWQLACREATVCESCPLATAMCRMSFFTTSLGRWGMAARIASSQTPLVAGRRERWLEGGRERTHVFPTAK